MCNRKKKNKQTGFEMSLIQVIVTASSATQAGDYGKVCLYICKMGI